MRLENSWHFPLWESALEALGKDVCFSASLHGIPEVILNETPARRPSRMGAMVA